MGNPRIPLQPSTTYHIYNRAVGNEKLFLKYYNYDFFLEKIIQYILPCTKLISYCFLPNHFHLLLRTESESHLLNLWEQQIKKKLYKHYKIHSKNIENDESDMQLRIAINTIVDKLIIDQFAHCFNAYVQAFNKTERRMGGLMKESFQRKQIDSDDYLKTVISYIHNNPVKHGYVDQIKDWPHSSYNQIINKDSQIIDINHILDLYDDIENFKSEMIKFNDQ